MRNAAGAVIGTGVVGANGAFVIALDGAVEAGQVIDLVQTDAAGNASPAIDFTIPATPAPATPAELALSADGSELSGVATPGNRVEVHAADGTLLGSAIAAQDGSFTLTLVPAQANGEALEVFAVDVVTNQASIPASLTAADITPPVAPSELGVSADGTVLTGRGEPGSTVRVVDAQGTALGTAVINATGSFAITLDPPQTAGQRLQVSAEDAAGNLSNSAAITAPNLEAPVDDTPPAAPTGLVINAGGSQLSGRGEAGTSVSVRDAQGNLIASATVAADGSFSVTLSPAVTDGSTLEVQLSDAAGNVSEATSITSPDLIAPAQPTALTLLDGVTLTGSGEPGATVQVRDATGALIGSGQVGAGGTFSVTLDAPQRNGELLDIRLVDAAGNSSTPLQFQAPDTTAPAAVSDVVVSADGLSVSGDGEPGATVQVRDAAGNLIGSGTVGANGSFVLELDSPLAAGQVISLVQTDAAGNASPATDFSVPSTPAPATPGDLLLSADGSSLTGSATPGTRVEVRGADGTLLGSAVAGANGAVAISLTPAQRNGESLEVVAVDPATGQNSIPATLTAPDTTAPDAPAQLLVSADGSSLSGRAEAGSSIRVTNAQGELIGTAQAAANGTFSVTLDPAQTEGQTLQVSAEDAAGNVSNNASITAPNLEAPTDDTPPEAPTGLVINTGGSQLSGRGEAGTTVTVRDAQGNVIASGVVTAEGEFSITLDPPVIDGSRLQVLLTDAAGNDSTPVSLSSPDLTPPAQPGDLQLVDGSVLSGTGEAGAQVRVRDANGILIGRGQVDADGRFELVLDVPQLNGETLDIRLLDAAGNSSTPLLFQAPDISSPDPVSDIVVSVDGSLIGGRGEPGAVVSVRDGNGQLLGTGVVGIDGNFVLTLDPAVQAGATLTLVQTDAAGLTSDFVNHLVSAIPALPSPGDLLLAEDGSSLSGSAPAGVTVQVRNANGETLASVVVGAEGTFTLPLNPPIADGQPLHVVALHANGSSSLPTPITAPDLTAPDAPVELSVSADGSLLIGRAEPGSQVQVRDAQGTLLGSGTVNGTGSFVVSLEPAQVDGQALQVSATDAAGNTSLSGSVSAPDLSLPVDITPPEAPTALAISNDGSRVSGRGEPGTVVRVLDAQGQVLAEAAVPANGEFTVQLQPPVIDGSPLRVTLTDAAGNSSSAPLTAPDLVAPEPAADLLLSDGQTLTGSAEAGARVEVRDADGELLGSALADGDGRFSLTLDTPLRNGETLTVQVIDAAGNRSTTLDYAVPDTTPPAAVSEVQIDLTDSVLAGRGEPGALVQVRDADGVLLGSADVAADGSFRVTLDPPVTAGAVLSAVQQDAAGNVSTALEFSVPPTVLPASPSDVQVSADGSSVSGNASAGSEVQVRDADGTLIGSVQAGADGRFDIPLEPPLRNGESLSVVVLDAAGNSSLPTATQAPDTTAPLPASDLQLSADGSTLSGRGEAGARVEVRNAQGELLGSASVADNGSFSLTLQPAQIQGQQLDVSLTDAAGNSSAPSSVTAPDLLGPLQPSAIVVDASGSLLSGVGQVGSTLTVRGADGEVLGSTTVGASGRFEISLEPVQRNGQQLSVEASDAAGNSAEAVTITVADTQPPAPVEALQLSADGLQVSGQGEPGAVVSVRAADGSVLGAAQVDADGTFTVTLDSAQRNGQALTVEQRDAAGNVSEQVALQAPDLEAPAAPSELRLSADGTTLTGLGEPGTSVTVRNAEGLVGSAEVGADGRFSVTLTPAQLNGQALSTTLTDAAGNVSPPVELTAPDLQPPLAADDLQLNPAGTLLSGSAEPGSRVEVRDSAGALLGSAVVDDDGRFSVSLPAQTNGEVLAVQVIDGQGNASPSASYTAADTTAPDAPSELQINASGSQISGRGEVGSVVEVRNAAGVLVGEGLVLEDGAFLINLQPAQDDGQALQVTLRDAAGNTSEAADLTAPNTAPPEAPASATVSLDGSSVSGSAPGASLVVVRDAAGNELASAPVAADGSFTVTLPNPLTNGEALNIVAVDGGGLSSAELPVNAPDTTPPAAAQNVLVSADGSSISGNAEPGSTVIVRNAGGDLGQTTAASDGSFVLTVEPPLQPGDSAEVVVIDQAGNETLEPVGVSVPPAEVIDTPSALQISLDGFSLSGQATAGTVVSVSAGGVALGSATVGSDGSFLVFLERAQLNGEVLQVSARADSGAVSEPASITARDITPPDAPLQIVVERDGSALTGRGEAGATASVRDSAGNLLGTGLVDGDGVFRIDLQPAPVNGETLLVRLSDAAGNASPISSVQAPDITPPQAATALALNDAATVLSGRGEVGASVSVRDADGVLLATGTVNQSGQFQITLPNAQISGARLQVTLTDAAGNISDPASVATPDRTPPAAVSQLNLSVDGSQLTGTGEPGASVRVRNATGAVVGSATVDADGYFSITFTPPQNSGQPLGVTQVDATGNVSPAVTLSTPDLQAPAAPSNLVLNNDGLTLRGVGEAGSQVSVRNAQGALIGTGQVAANGSFTLTLDSAQLNGEALSVVLTDAAGNVSNATPLLAPDLTPPAAPDDLLLASGGLQLSGSAEAGSTITVRTASGDVLGTVTVAGNGTFQLTLDSAQTNGEQLSITATDGAGNVSPVASLTAADTTPPALVTHLAVAADGSSLSGHGEVGATVTVRNANGEVLGSAKVDADGHFLVTLTPAAAPGTTLSVVQADASNNVSLSETFTLPGVLAPQVPEALQLAADGLSVSGQGSVGSRIEVYGPTGVLLGSAEVRADGSFTVNLQQPQANGERLEVSALGEDGTRSLPVLLQAPDTTAPQPLSELRLSVDGLVVTGRGEAGAQVSITGNGGVILGSGQVGANGRFSVTLNGAQINGERLDASQTDAAGNTSDSVSLLAPDLLAPEPADNLQLSAGGSLLQGTGEAAARVTVLAADGSVLGTGTVRLDGTFQVALLPHQANGETFDVVLTDAAGNRSAVAEFTAPDTTPPAALSEVSVAADGASLSGRGEVGARVTVRNADGEILGSATVDASGNFSLVLDPPLGNAEVLSLSQADAAGNVSPVITLTTPDFTPPAALTEVRISADGAVLTGRGEPGASVTISDAAGVVIGRGVVQADETFRVELTPAQINNQQLSVVQADPPGNLSEAVLIIAPDRTPPLAPQELRLNAAGDLLSGTGEANTTVRVSVAGVEVGRATVGADGRFSVALDTPLRNGEQLQVTLEDASQNLSLPTLLDAPDLTPPAQVVASLDAEGTRLSGSGEAGARLTVLNNFGDRVGQGTIDAEGRFVVELTPAQRNGEVLSIIAQDAAGNPSQPLLLTAPDLTPPAQLQDLSLNPTGTTLTGSGEVGSTVRVRGADGSLLGEAVVPAGGAFVITLLPPQANGQTLSVSAADAAGNTSTLQTVVAADTTAPDPVSNLSINSAYEVLVGRGEAGATVRVVQAGALLGSAEVGADGRFQVSLSPKANPGVELAVTQTDAAGNTSTVVPYTTPLEPVPATPTLVSLSVDGLVVSGRAAAGSEVRVVNAAGTLLGSAQASAAGTFTVELNQAQLNGQRLDVSARSSGGESQPFVLIAADVTAPAQPLVTALSANGLVLSGSGEAGATVTVRSANGTLLGTAVVGLAGTFSVDLASAQLNGQVLSVRQTDAAGNPSPVLSYTVPDVQAPLAPSNLQLLDGGSRLSGVGEAGARVEVTGRGGVVLGSTTVAANGQFSLVLNAVQADGQVLTVRQTDAAGNTSASTSLTAPDTTPPALPSATLNAAGTLLSGSGEAGARVIVRSNGSVVGQAVVAANGTFVVTLSAAQINHETLSVSLTDAAGNVSPVLTLTAPDITPPAIAGNLLVNATGSELSGTGEVGARVTVRGADGSVLQSGVVIGADGTFRITLNPVQDNGQRLSVTLTDPRGNVSGIATVVAPDVDADRPVVASDNLVTAVVNLAPVTSKLPTINDSYTLLVGLNTTKAFTWSVAAGTTVNPTLTLAVDNLVGVLNNPTFTLQVKNAAGAWVDVATGSNSALLTLILLPGVGVRAEIGALRAGDYQLLVTSGGLGVVTTVNTRLDLEVTSLTQFTGSGVVKSGNVITDPGTDGTPDILGPDDGAVLQVLKGGVYVNAGAATSVQGLYGTLVIKADGSYTYTPSGTPASVGKVDVFSYQLSHPNGKSDTANLYVRIDSPQATEIWSDSNLGAPATVVDAVDDVGRSTVSLTNKLTPGSQAFDPISLAGLAGTRVGTVTHTVASNTTADLEVNLTTNSLLNLGNSITLELSKLGSNGRYTVMETVSGSQLLDLLGSGGKSHVFRNQTAGTYQVAIKAAVTLGLSGSVTASLNTTTKSLTEFVVNTATTATGNLLNGDTLGSNLTTLSVQTAANSYALPGYNGVSVAGLYGTLLVFADGSYTYTLKPGLSAAVVGQVDTFNYALTHPNGSSDTAQLKITIATGASGARMLEAQADEGSEAVVLAALADQQDDGQDAVASAAATPDTDDEPASAAQTLDDEQLAEETGFASIGADNADTTLLWQGGDASIDLASLVGEVHDLEVLDLNASSAVSLSLTLDDVLAVTHEQGNNLLIKGDDADTVRFGDAWTLTGQQVAAGIDYNQYTAEEDPSQQLWVQNGIHVV
nr:BapA/Bap/LapF family large adhesin [Pseudomonas cremoricolorata]